MSLLAAQIEQFCAARPSCVLVRPSSVRGSAPRDTDALMIVADETTLGTIGGGQLEYIAIDQARKLLRDGADNLFLDVPLGPDIGQCCGGHVQLEFARIDAQLLSKLSSDADRRRAQAPHVYVFGAGHVGRALAHGLAPLPYVTRVIDTRADALHDLPAQIETRLAAMPEAEARDARPASAFVVLTHDHALDFLIMGEILKRGDALYAGMIGSKSKRAQFSKWFRREVGDTTHLKGLTCPIGAHGLGDKRPEVIAALVVAEIIANFGARDWASPEKFASLDDGMGIAHGV